ncbi:DUF4268 domain-containing protein [Janibacter anophelis]|uniref:DUF4268 domain-containing protein n=1 Tax=Janibacter anophelis TaxID=319054 RepID=UPI000836DA2A|nr:DUF4268 domain-containing protein [Janibacter anophelis]
METFKRAPLQLFNMPQHFVIPLFQRPYVWKQDEQWEPLWQDIRRVAELRITQPHVAAQHFLGAVVLQAHPAGINRVTTWNVIDGQQRLTTLQLLMDATHALLAAAGATRLADQLEMLTHNPTAYVPEGESILKLRHLNNDRSAFDEVMTAEAPIDHASLERSESQLVQAHHYFTTVVSEWLGEPAGPGFPDRSEQLTAVLTGELTIVTIELLATENSQEIFETLNARGTPLTAADLVRNFVFQTIEAEGGDTRRAYKELWPFETKFWMKEVSVGRNFVTRSSLFLNQWLAAELGEEISPQSTFARFKAYVDHDVQEAMVDLLPRIKQQADLYHAWTEAATRPSGDLSTVEMAMYRMQSSGIELLKPLLIWLHSPVRALPQSVIERVVSAAESWVIRRQLLRMTNSDLGRIVAEIMAANRDVPADELADRVVGQLARLNVASTYWPGDDEVRQAMTVESAYRRFPRPRLRAYLEAIENLYRAETGQPQIERVGHPIEHILPQKWQDSWPVATPEEEDERQQRVHRLGNLTLLTQSLNSRVSNGPWTTKRTALLQHNTIKLTGRLIDSTEGDEWSETRIDERTTRMVDALLEVWPVPEGHLGRVIDPQTKAGDWVELKHLVEGDVLRVGDRLFAAHRDFAGREATIGADMRLHLDGKKFDTPSGAAKHLRKKATNGWYFWTVADGRRLREVRQQFLGGAEARDASARAALYREFWGQTFERMRAQHPEWTRATTSSASWIDVSLGVPGVVVATAWYQSGLAVQLYFNSSDPEINDQRYQWLHARRAQFEQAVGEALAWDAMVGRKATRVSLESPFLYLDRREEWGPAIEWLIAAQRRLRLGVDTLGGVDAFRL